MASETNGTWGNAIEIPGLGTLNAGPPAGSTPTVPVTARVSSPRPAARVIDEYADRIRAYLSEFS